MHFGRMQACCADAARRGTQSDERSAGQLAWLPGLAAAAGRAGWPGPPSGRLPTCPEFKRA